MMSIVSGDRTSFGPMAMQSLAEYRYRVFVERLGWTLPARDGLEYDQFDSEHTIYVVARRAGVIVGTARLLPTTRPYLLESCFPDLLGSIEPPRSECVWELSRFAAVDLDSDGSSEPTQIASKVAVPLLRQSIRYAAQRGAEHLITVSPVGIERLLRRNGFEFHAALPTVVDGRPLQACWIACH